MSNTIALTMLATALSGRLVAARARDGLTAQTGWLAFVESDGAGYRVLVDTQQAGVALKWTLLHEVGHIALGHVDHYASVPLAARPALERAADDWAAKHAADLERLCKSMFGCEFAALVV